MWNRARIDAGFSCRGCEGTGRLAILFLLAVAVTLGACSSGGTKEIQLTTAEAQAVAVDDVKGVMGDAACAMGMVALDSEVLGLYALLFGAESGVGEEPGEEDVNQLELDLEQSLQDIFDDILQNPVRDGNTITYTPDPSAVCDGTEDLLDPVACTEIVSHLTIVQTLLSETSGRMSIRYDGVEAMVVGYSTTSGYLEVDLAGLKYALQEAALILDPEAPLDLPDTFSGAVRITTSSPEPCRSTLTLAITRTINIGGPVDCGTMLITIAQTSKLIEMSADRQAGLASIEVDVGAVSVQIPFEDDMEICHLAEFSLAGLTLFAQASAGTDTLLISNVGIGGAPMTLDIDDEEALRVELGEFGMSVNAATNVFTTTSALDLVVTMANVQGYLEMFFDTDDPTLAGSYTATVPSGTAMMPVETGIEDDTVGKLTAGGPMTVTGSGEFTGSVTISAGDCFDLFPDSEDFPLATVPCPPE